MRKLDIQKGDRYGRLNVIEEVAPKGKDRIFFVECDCGKGFDVRLSAMRSGKTKSCGCINKENPYARKHGHNSRKSGQSRTYYTWSAMLQRCNNPNSNSYDRYGGRGITVCKRWLKFENFLADMGEKPQGLVIDRINNERSYFPKNCRWTTVSINNANRRKWTNKKQSI